MGGAEKREKPKGRIIEIQGGSDTSQAYYLLILSRKNVKVVEQRPITEGFQCGVDKLKVRT